MLLFYSHVPKQLSEENEIYSIYLNQYLEDYKSYLEDSTQQHLILVNPFTHKLLEYNADLNYKKEIFENPEHSKIRYYWYNNHNGLEICNLLIRNKEWRQLFESFPTLSDKRKRVRLGKIKNETFKVRYTLTPNLKVALNCDKPKKHTAIIEFSKVAIQGDKAVFVMNRYSKCLDADGTMVLMKKINNQWQVKTIYELWVS